MSPSQTGSHSRARAVVVGSDGFPRWSHEHAAAWLGLLGTHRRLTRELDAELEAAHGLTLSGLELLVRPGSAPEHWLRLSTLAAEAGLSLSRVSRIVDSLEARGLIERRPCAQDARAINAALTPNGLELARQAQSTHLAAVCERFFNRLDAAEIQTLAAVFERFAPDAVGQCAASSA